MTFGELIPEDEQLSQKIVDFLNIFCDEAEYDIIDLAHSFENVLSEVLIHLDNDNDIKIKFVISDGYKELKFEMYMDEYKNTVKSVKIYKTKTS